MKRVFKRLIATLSVSALAAATFVPIYADAAVISKIVFLRSIDETEQLSCVEVEGVPVPYVAVDEYYNIVYSNSCTCEKLSNNTYKLDNGRGTMIIDPAGNTIHFDEPEIFLYPVDEKATAVDISRLTAVKYKGASSELDIDLDNYNIDIIEEENKVFLPLTTLSDFFSVTTINAVYAADDISFNSGTNPQIVNWQTNFDSLTRDKSEAQFSYNELCFVFDTLYGCPPNCEFADSIKSKGFDGFLQSESDETRKVRELLLSTSTVDYIQGLGILECMLDDGGHSTFIAFLFTEIADTEGYKAFLDFEKNNPNDPGVLIFKDWYKKYIAYTNSHNAIMDYEHLLDQYTPIFDEEDGENYYRYYEYDNTGIYAYTEYNDDASIYLKKALDIAKAHGMKNFVFDEAKNGGGADDSLMYMMNAITGCNYPELYMRSILTGNKVVQEYEYDMDQDGVIEGDDEDVDYDFNYAVMCSAYSYSCGNLFPCLCKEEGVPIIGETSAGGTDVRETYRNTLGGVYTLSSYKELTYRNGGNVEAGAAPDYDITKKNPDGSVDYTDFYNFELISNIVNAHYKNAAMYRLYNPNSGEHFFTANVGEKDILVNLGWKFESIPWDAPAVSDIPVYRVYNPNSGDHHFTANAAERDILVGLGWNDEGIGWYSADGSGQPVYRLYNPNATSAGSHHFTASEEERDLLIGLGWRDEGIGWYGE